MDTVGDFLTRIRNAGIARHEKVDVPASKIRSGIAKILSEEGYIRNYKVVPDGKQGMMRVYLKYKKTGEPVISFIQRVSRPGKRIYFSAADIPEIRSGFGKAVVTTSKGIMTGEAARSAGVGGEMLFKVW